MIYAKEYSLILNGNLKNTANLGFYGVASFKVRCDICNCLRDIVRFLSSHIFSVLSQYFLKKSPQSMQQTCIFLVFIYLVLLVDMLRVIYGKELIAIMYLYQCLNCCWYENMQVPVNPQDVQHFSRKLVFTCIASNMLPGISTC